ncbi:non-ribosomal peptide synthetase [Streptomyces sp. NPDC048637]|uniref:non-ribosomal peptide synthetase n=1 Tax=Streptomyces sp. NPDC048637 TaxID=3155636 RepID=UPI00343F1018
MIAREAVTGLADPAAVDVLTLMERHFRSAPDHTALVVGESTLTYRQLAEESGELAARIAARGTVRPGRGQVVLLYQRQSVRTVVGMVAALRLGAAWCVVEPGQHEPSEPAAGRVRALLGDTDCAAVVFDGADAATTPETVRALASGIALHDLSATPATPAVAEAPPAPAPRAEVPGAAPAYVISTSGSTSAPKAVVVSRANLAHLMAGRGEEPGGATFAPCRLAWDGALLLLFHALCTGGTTVLPDARRLPDAAAAAALIRTWRVRTAASPPSFYRLMLPHMSGADLHLRTLILGGEAVPQGLAGAHHGTLPGTRLWNEYGPTETTVGVLSHLVPDSQEPVGPAKSLPIGCPIGPSTRAYVLGHDLSPAPGGTLGELYIGGPQVAHGYAGRPAETAGRFVADPFTDVPGARMYRTGDLARVNAAGEVEFGGREDGQMKVRGARIERHAVEAVLESHPAVRRASVLGVTDERAGDTLVGFWSPDRTAAAAPTVRDLLAHCAGQLVEQAVPERFVQVADIPLTAVGKTDETALRALLRHSEAEPERPGAYVNGDIAPAGRGGNALEREIAVLWAEVLRHDEFGLGDGFFAAGGNSRRVVELHLRLQRRWPDAIRVGRLFDLDTVRAQATAVAEALAATGSELPVRAPMTFEV